MRVVIAPDSFKNSLPAAGVSRSLAEGWRSVDPDVRVTERPMADGGEGTVDAIAAGDAGAQRMPVTVTGPNGTPVAASWLLLSDGVTGVVELASTSGIELLSELRGWDADSHGFGEAIAAALDHGVTRLILGIGSSASTDGGTGMLRALGARFLDAEGVEVAPGARGLAAIHSVDRSALRAAPETLVLTDVTNPLCGPEGAAAIFGPQKGLTDPADIAVVDAALAALSDLLGADATMPGAGAAGGVGAALAAWGAVPVAGSGWIADRVGLAAAIADADLVVTGEGSYDGQSAAGKVPSLVGELAAAAGVPVALVAGRIASDTGHFAAAVSLTELAGSGERAMAETAQFCTEAGAALAAQLSGIRSVG